jgi:hypothetical protein
MIRVKEIIVECTGITIIDSDNFKYFIPNTIIELICEKFCVEKTKETFYTGDANGKKLIHFLFNFNKGCA